MLIGQNHLLRELRVRERGRRERDGEEKEERVGEKRDLERETQGERATCQGDVQRGAGGGVRRRGLAMRALATARALDRESM